MNKTDYLFEGHRQLSNIAHYEKLDQLRQPETSKKILDILRKMKNERIITDKQFDYLEPPDNPRPRRFYTLPKIHKPSDTWTVLK